MLGRYPRIGCLERRFITKVLKLVDFLLCTSSRSRSLHANTVRGYHRVSLPGLPETALLFTLPRQR